tara:strand:+ start:3391 stop:3879 length:489 start_codon:yes stop_codon:yes gene_type:complete
MNKVILCGHLGADPELRSTTSGTAVCNLRIATNSRIKGPDGEWTDHTEWHSVVVWQAQAETCAKYLSKGRQVLIDGRLQTRPWTDRDGNERQKTEVVAERVEFVGQRDSGDEAAPSGRGGRQGGEDRSRQQDSRQGGQRGGSGYRGSYGGHGDGGGKNDIPF